MKKNYFTLVVLILSFFSVKSQITITTSDLPSTGDTLRYSFTALSQGHDFSQTGQDHFWDFSELGLQSQGLDEYYSVSSVNFLMGIFFGSGTMARPVTDQIPIDELGFEISNFYGVYLKTEQAYTNNGFFFIYSGLPIPLKYSNNDYVFRLPLNYSDSDSTAFNGSQSLSDTLNFHRQGYRVNEVDGWGTIATPYGEFECLRVKTTLYEADSLYWVSLPEPISLKRTTTIYTWLAKEEKFPVLEASFLVMENDTEVFLGARYRDIYREPEVLQPPVADFYASLTHPDINELVQLINLSTPGHDVNTYQWLIEPDGFEYMQQTGPASTEPVIAFLQPGIFSVSLSAQNEAGQHTLVKEDYIHVTDTDTSADFLPPQSSLPEIRLTNNGNTLKIHNLYPDRWKAFRILDMNGRFLKHNKIVSSETAVLDISSLASGTYVILFVPVVKGFSPVSVKFIRP